MENEIVQQCKLLEFFHVRNDRLTKSWLFAAVLLGTFLIISCSSMNVSQEKQNQMSGTNVKEKEIIGLQESKPQPGDIKVVDDVEYIYASNLRYMFTPYEPEYMWIRKDLYTPRIGENLLSRNAKEKEQLRQLEERIRRLEQELKKMGNS